MSKMNEQAEKLKKILGLNREPVGIKLLKKEEIPVGTYDSSKSRYCQALMQAGAGKQLILDSSNMSCAAASAAFGFRPLHPKLASGEAYFNIGQVASIEAGKTLMENMTRLNQNEYDAVMVSPLATIEYEPDVVVIESETEHLMWLAFASIYETGERLNFNSAMIEASCVDSTIIPFRTGKINTSLGCLGCRDATDIKSSEGFIGIPYSLVDKIVVNLEKLSEKVIPGIRDRKVLKRFQEKE